MICFDSFQKSELKKWLFYSKIHDSRIKNTLFDENKESLIVTAYNSIDEICIKMKFEKVDFYAFVAGNYIGNSEVISSLTLEEICDSPFNIIELCKDGTDDMLYLLFQMFSGDEFHIVSKRIQIEEVVQHSTGDDAVCSE